MGSAELLAALLSGPNPFPDHCLLGKCPKIRGSVWMRWMEQHLGKGKEEPLLLWLCLLQNW